MRPSSTARAVVVAGVLLAATVSGLSSAAGVAGYGDVQNDRYFTEPVQWSVDNGITDIGGPCLDPDAPVSRADAALYLWNMQQQPLHDGEAKFTDTGHLADAHLDAINWMAENGITTGTSPDTYSPDDTLTRAQSAAFLWRLAGKPPAPPHPFVDIHKGWQQGAVSWMAQTGITTGTSATTFTPDRQLTRKEVITFLWRYQNKPATTINPATPPCRPPTIPVSAGDSHSCAVATDDTITCWGDNGWGQADAPTGTYKAVSAGLWHSCAVATDDTITCWGANLPGRTDTPAGTYKTVTAAGYWGEEGAGSHSCAVATDGTIACWGTNRHGQTDSPAGTYKTVSASWHHSCAVATDDTIACWGADWSGQTDAPTGTYKTVSAGRSHSCAVATDGTVACWGWNRYGQTVAPTGTYKTVSAGRFHSCAVATDDTVTCWGNNEYGQTDAPTGTYKAVSAGGGHSCAVATDDTVTCWGADWSGQTDTPTTI